MTLKKRWKGCCAAVLALCMGLCGPGGVLASAADVLPEAVSQPALLAESDFSFVDVDNTGRYVLVNYTGSLPSSSGSLQFAVWSEQNGQDDLEWVSGISDGNGGHYILLDTSRHNEEIGVYYIHVYWQTASGAMIFQQGTDYTIQSIQHPGALFLASPDSLEQTAAIAAADYNMPADGAQLIAAVWSEQNGQDDLEWIAMLRDGNRYGAVCNLLSHNSSGNYNVHFYLQHKNGSMELVGNTVFTVIGSTLSRVTVENQNNNQGTCQIRITGVDSPSGIAQVQVAAWSREDQSNILWYQASSAGNGTYLVNFNMSNHQYDLGTYQLHVYVTNGNGLMELKGNTTVSFVAQAAATAQVNGASCHLQATNLMVPGGLQSVQFAVWSDVNGQDDLHWITANIENDSASSTISLGDYSGYGTYQVHVYGMNAAGRQILLCNTTFSLARPQVDEIQVFTGRNDGSFRLVVTGLENYGVQKVRIPVWSQSDQSDIVWYDTTRQSDGSYQLISSVASHNYHIGNYTAHIYATDQRGEESCIAGTSFNFSASIGAIEIGHDASEFSGCS